MTPPDRTTVSTFACPASDARVRERSSKAAMERARDDRGSDAAKARVDDGGKRVAPIDLGSGELTRQIDSIRGRAAREMLEPHRRWPSNVIARVKPRSAATVDAVVLHRADASATMRC